MILRPILTLKLLLMSSCVFMLQAKGPTSTLSAEDNQLAEAYIRNYFKIAVEEMERVGMPASVILAQGMLESDFGRSELAVNAHNHFGIKCHKGWSGESFFVRSTEYTASGTTERNRQCFRQYNSVEDSYRDHSAFLTSRSHYDFLFQAKDISYKYWAEGLRKAGYATDPAYSQKLVSIIEQYDLARYDRFSNKYNIPGEERIRQFNADPFIETSQEAMALRVQISHLENSLAQAEFLRLQMQETIDRMKADIQLLRQQSLIDKNTLVEQIAKLEVSSHQQTAHIAELQQKLNKVEHIQQSMLKSDPLAKHFNPDGSPRIQLEIFPTRHRNAEGVFYQSGRRATALNANQTLEDIARIYSISYRDLLKYNDLEMSEATQIPVGCYIYLESKATVAVGEQGPHIVKAGESILTISQRYGIKLSKLQQRNLLKKGEEPLAGEFIFLNATTDKKPAVKATLENSVSDLDNFGGGGSSTTKNR